MPILLNSHSLGHRRPESYYNLINQLTQPQQIQQPPQPMQSQSSLSLQPGTILTHKQNKHKVSKPKSKSKAKILDSMEFSDDEEENLRYQSDGDDHNMLYDEEIDDNDDEKMFNNHKPNKSMDPKYLEQQELLKELTSNKRRRKQRNTQSNITSNF